MTKSFLSLLSAILLLAQGASALVYLDPANGDDRQLLLPLCFTPG